MKETTATGVIESTGKESEFIKMWDELGSSMNEVSDVWKSDDMKVFEEREE